MREKVVAAVGQLHGNAPSGRDLVDIVLVIVYDPLAVGRFLFAAF
jgi:hypothetical protein